MPGGQLALPLGFCRYALPGRVPTLTAPDHGNRLWVFLCHASQDKSFVRKLYHTLVQEEMAPWLDEESLLPGQDWDREIRLAIKNSDVVVACLSNRSVNKTGYVQKEIKQALDVADEQPEGSIYLIPIRLDDCPIPRRLSHLHAIGQDGEDFSRLLSALKVQATALKRHVPKTEIPQSAKRSMDHQFAQALGQLLWRSEPAHPPGFKNGFTVSIIGEVATGKTSLLTVMAGKFPMRMTGRPPMQIAREFPMRGTFDKNEPCYQYKLEIDSNLYMADHFSYTSEPQWQATLGFLKTTTSLVLFTTNAQMSCTKSDLAALREIKKLGLPLAIVVTMVDQLQASEVKPVLDRVESLAGLSPLPVSAVTGQNIDALKCYIYKCRSFYSQKK